MKNALITLLCTIVLGCIGGRSVSTTVHQAKLLKPIKLEDSGLVIKPISLTHPSTSPVEVKPAYTRPDIITGSSGVEVTPIPLTPVAPSNPTSELKPTELKPIKLKPVEIEPVEIKPIDITPLKPAPIDLLPFLEVEQIILKEIELPKPMHIKVMYLLVYYGLAALVFWLGLRWWSKRRAKKAPVRRKRRTRKKP